MFETYCVELWLGNKPNNGVLWVQIFFTQSTFPAAILICFMVYLNACNMLNNNDDEDQQKLQT